MQDMYLGIEAIGCHAQLNKASYFFYFFLHAIWRLAQQQTCKYVAVTNQK